MNTIRIRKFDIFHVAATAVIVLLLGTAYYWFTRPQGSAAFLSLLPAFPLDQNSSFIVQWLGWLPTFTHVFAFSLLTYLALGRRHILFASILWGVINALFELGQALPARIIQLLPDLFNLHAYFSNGVFDLLDLVACGIGAWAAWAFLLNQAVQHDQYPVGADNEYKFTGSNQSKSRRESS